MTYLPREVRTRLAGLGYFRSDSTTRWTFRDRLLEGYATFTLISPTSFSIELPVNHYSTSLQYGWSRGHARIAKHEEGFGAVLADASVPIAWKLVTGYYTAYFCALELLRASGLALVRLGPEHIARVVEQSTNVGTLEPGTYVGELSANPLNAAVRGRLVKSTYGDHEIVWRRLNTLIASLAPRTSEERELQQLLGVFLRGEREWLSPNAVRNEWNYARPDFYVGIGQQHGRMFCSLASRRERAYAWLRTRRLRPSDANVAATIAVWRALLSGSVDEVDPVLRT